MNKSQKKTQILRAAVASFVIISLVVGVGMLVRAYFLQVPSPQVTNISFETKPLPLNPLTRIAGVNVRDLTPNQVWGEEIPSEYKLPESAGLWLSLLHGGKLEVGEVIDGDFQSLVEVANNVNSIHLYSDRSLVFSTNVNGFSQSGVYGLTSEEISRLAAPDPNYIFSSAYFEPNQDYLYVAQFDKDGKTIVQLQKPNQTKVSLFTLPGKPDLKIRFVDAATQEIYWQFMNEGQSVCEQANLISKEISAINCMAISNSASQEAMQQILQSLPEEEQYLNAAVSDDRLAILLEAELEGLPVKTIKIYNASTLELIQSIDNVPVSIIEDLVFDAQNQLYLIGKNHLGSQLFNFSENQWQEINLTECFSGCEYSFIKP